MLRNFKILLIILFSTLIVQAQDIQSPSCSILSGTITCGGSSLTPGSGSVTSISVTTANGVSGTVVTPTTTPAISLTLGAITPTSVSTGVITGSTLNLSGAGAASAPGLKMTGSIFSGTAANTFPYFFIQPTGATAITTFDTAGAPFGINVLGTFTGTMIDLFVGGTRVAKIGSFGDAYFADVIATGSSSSVFSSAAAALAFTTTARKGRFSQGGFVTASTNIICFSANDGAGSDGGTGQDTCFSRDRPGVFDVGTGAVGSTAGSMQASTISAANMAVTSIASDSGLSDNSVCVDSTGRLYKGSGVAGICLGTSSIRYKHDLKPIDVGLNEIVKLNPQKGYYNKGYGDDGLKEQNWIGIAEDVFKILPQCVGLDKNNRPNTIDPYCVLAISIKAIQQQQTQIEDLKRKLN